MRTARFFVPEEWIARGAEAFTIPSGAIHKQIVLVLRMKVGDAVSLMTNDGNEIEGHITEITRSAVMGVIAGDRVMKPLRPDVIVCAAITKRDTFEWMLQKCTELGASGFVPLLTDRVVKRPKDTPRRWNDIVREAAEQSGRVTLPVVYDPMSLAAAVGKFQDRVKIVLHEAAGKGKMPSVREMDRVVLFVGPEGGFTDPEIALLRDDGASVVQIGDLVFRAETAAVVGMALVRLG